MVSKYKAEEIEREYIQKMVDDTYDSIKETNDSRLSSIIPDCIRDTIFHEVAIEVVARRMWQLAKWN